MPFIITNIMNSLLHSIPIKISVVIKYFIDLEENVISNDPTICTTYITPHKNIFFFYIRCCFDANQNSQNKQKCRFFPFPREEGGMDKTTFNTDEINSGKFATQTATRAHVCVSYHGHIIFCRKQFSDLCYTSKILNRNGFSGYIE